jgi:hypothetical protein
MTQLRHMNRKLCSNRHVTRVQVALKKLDARGPNGEHINITGLLSVLAWLFKSPLETG